MNPLKKLFKQTVIYGLATVLPKMISVFLVRIHTDNMETNVYGKLSVVFANFAILNVVLAYGMETAFFRFYNKTDDKDKVVSTSLISIALSTVLLLGTAFVFKDWFADFFNIDRQFVTYILLILGLDALAIIPFAWLRVTEQPTRYAIIKLLNVLVNFGLNIFFIILLPGLAETYNSSFLATIYIPDFQISYILIANLIANGITLLLILKPYVTSSYSFDVALWKKMMKYGLPVLIAGLAFTVNEVIDRHLLTALLPADVADSEVGMYSACYKLGMFMTLFATAFRLGIEPFFFSHAGTKNPQKAYAQITNYFVILGSVILLAVIVYADILKLLFVNNETYWEAMKIVPIITLAGFFLGIYHNLSVWYKVTDKTRYGALISIIGALVTIGVNYAFIPIFGYMASAIATLLAYGCMMVISYYLGKANYPVPYNFRKITFYLSISIVFSIVSFYVFDRNLIIGSVLLLLFLGLVYKLENQTLRKIIVKK